MPGAAWRNAYEWGTDLLFAVVYRFCSWPGLVPDDCDYVGLTTSGYLTRFLSARLEAAIRRAVRRNSC